MQKPRVKTSTKAIEKATTESLISKTRGWKVSTRAHLRIDDLIPVVSYYVFLLKLWNSMGLLHFRCKCIMHALPGGKGLSDILAFHFPLGIYHKRPCNLEYDRLESHNRAVAVSGLFSIRKFWRVGETCLNSFRFQVWCERTGNILIW